MGNLIHKDVAPQLPKGDIFKAPAPSNIATKSSSSTFPISQNNLAPLPAIAPTFSYHSYTIWTNSYYKHRIKPEDWSNYNTRINQNVDEMLKESEERLRNIQRQRAILETSQLTDRESKKPAVSIESCMDQSDRYSMFSFLDKKYFTPKPERPVLNDEMLLAIRDASRPEPSNEVLVEIDGVQIMRKDMRTLTNLNWLNDEIINAYLHLIVLRGQEPKRKRVYAFNTFFYPKLRESGYNSIKRWTRKVDIFTYDFLLVPVHLGNHWCLAFVNFNNRTICYYDSLGGSVNGCCDTLLDYLRYESNDKKKQDFDDENWQQINCYADKGIPQQMNGSDCGVFACQFAEHLTRQAKLNFTQEHMPYFRRKMIYELLTKRILE